MVAFQGGGGLGATLGWWLGWGFVLAMGWWVRGGFLFSGWGWGGCGGTPNAHDSRERPKHPGGPQNNFTTPVWKKPPAEAHGAQRSLPGGPGHTWCHVFPARHGLFGGFQFFSSAALLMEGLGAAGANESWPKCPQGRVAQQNSSLHHACTSAGSLNSAGQTIE